jgi:hypothetical protein
MNAAGPAELAPARSALEVISGALSQRTNSGCVPRSPTIRSSTSTVLSASIDRSIRRHRKRVAGELVNDTEQLHRSSVVGHVELKIERPHMIRPLRSQPITRNTVDSLRRWRLQRFCGSRRPSSRHSR